MRFLLLSNRVWKLLPPMLVLVVTPRGRDERGKWLLERGTMQSGAWCHVPLHECRALVGDKEPQSASPLNCTDVRLPVSLPAAECELIYGPRRQY